MAEHEDPEDPVEIEGGSKLKLTTPRDGSKNLIFEVKEYALGKKRYVYVGEVTPKERPEEFDTYSCVRRSGESDRHSNLDDKLYIYLTEWPDETKENGIDCEAEFTMTSKSFRLRSDIRLNETPRDSGVWESDRHVHMNVIHVHNGLSHKDCHHAKHRKIRLERK